MPSLWETYNAGIGDLFNSDEDRLQELERRDGFYSFLYHELSSSNNSVEEVQTVAGGTATTDPAKTSIADGVQTTTAPTQTGITAAANDDGTTFTTLQPSFASLTPVYRNWSGLSSLPSVYTNRLRCWQQLPSVSSAFKTTGGTTLPTIGASVNDVPSTSAASIDPMWNTQIYNTSNNMGGIQGGIGADWRDLYGRANMPSNYNTINNCNLGDRCVLNHCTCHVMGGDLVGGFSGGNFFNVNQDDNGRNSNIKSDFNDKDGMHGDQVGMTNTESIKVDVDNESQELTTLKPCAYTTEPPSCARPKFHQMMWKQTKSKLKIPDDALKPAKFLDFGDDFRMYLRPPTPSDEPFSEFTVPLVRDRPHPLKETPEYKNWEKQVKVVDLREKFPHEPDVHAPFIGLPRRSGRIRAQTLQEAQRRVAEITELREMSDDEV